MLSCKTKRWDRRNANKWSRTTWTRVIALCRNKERESDRTILRIAAHSARGGKPDLLRRDDRTDGQASRQTDRQTDGQTQDQPPTQGEPAGGLNHPSRQGSQPRLATASQGRGPAVRLKRRFLPTGSGDQQKRGEERGGEGRKGRDHQRNRASDSAGL